jgi:hypothetical protein
MAGIFGSVIWESHSRVIFGKAEERVAEVIGVEKANIEVDDI